MRKLTDAEIKELQDFKGVRGGREKFFDKLEEIYVDDKECLAEIDKCRAMHDSLDFIESYPAHEKSQKMFYEFMDDLLNKIGYHKK